MERFAERTISDLIVLALRLLDRHAGSMIAGHARVQSPRAARVKGDRSVKPVGNLGEYESNRGEKRSKVLAKNFKEGFVTLVVARLDSDTPDRTVVTLTPILFAISRKESPCARSRIASWRGNTAVGLTDRPATLGAVQLCIVQTGRDSFADDVAL